MFASNCNKFLHTHDPEWDLKNKLDKYNSTFQRMQSYRVTEFCYI